MPLPLWAAILVCILTAAVAALYRPQWRLAAVAFAAGSFVWGLLLMAVLSRMSAGMSGFN